MIRLQLLFLFVIALTSVNTVAAQTGNHWMFSYNLDCYIENGEIKIDKRNVLSDALGHTISNYNGSLKLNCLVGLISDHTDEVLNQPIDYGVTSDRNTSVIMTINDSTFYVMYEDSDTTINYIQQVKLYSVVVSKIGDSFKIVQPKTLFYPYPVYGLTVIEDTLSGWWLVARTSASTFTSFYFSETCFGCKQQTSVIPIRFGDNWELQSGYTMKFIKRSPSGNYLAIIGDEFTFNAGLKVTQTLTMYNLAFDKRNGLVRFSDTIFSYYSANYKTQFVSYFDLEYSSNDSILYYKYHENKNRIDSIFIVQCRFSASNERTALWHYDYKEMIELVGRSYRELKLMSNGKLYYITGSGTGSSDPNAAAHFHEIEKPNEFNNSSFSINKFVVNCPELSNGSATYSKYNFIRVKPIFQYDCGATVTFQNNCDYALKDTKVEFFVEDSPGSGKYLPQGQKPQLTFTVNGDYAYKVVLKSAEAMYHEFFRDTIKIRIPPKPIPNFKVADTVVCRYSTVTFQNKSTGALNNPPINPKWVWSFGDGSTKTVNSFGSVKHAYNELGLYTVSLFYHNGFCDSTLVRNQYIRVVDAPKPGFAIDNSFGCAPFTVHLTDTSVYNIQFKKYYFSDSGWKDINEIKFSHTFIQAGDYNIVQRLYGNSSCVVQEDTAWIHIAPGFTAHDTAKIIVASYATNNRINVEWEALEAVSSYKLFRDNKLVFSTIMTSVSDTLSKPGIFLYDLIATDSCGTSTSAGIKVSPIYLKGSVIGNNDASILTFTPYPSWKQQDVQYELLSGQISISSSALPNTEILDDQFKVEGSSEKCYLVVGTNSSLVTESNVICLLYQPIILIPNAITPNGDGINDSFKPTTYGIESYSIKIYNQWGQLISSVDNAAWYPEKQLLGVYTYVLHCTTPTGRSIYHNGTLTVLP